MYMLDVQMWRDNKRKKCENAFVINMKRKEIADRLKKHERTHTRMHMHTHAMVEWKNQMLFVKEYLNFLYETNLLFLA